MADIPITPLGLVCLAAGVIGGICALATFIRWMIWRSRRRRAGLDYSSQVWPGDGGDGGGGDGGGD